MRQNSVQISGFVCKPEVRQFANSAVCRFNLGISRIEKKGEESVTNTAYLPVEVWKANASDLASLIKGANVELAGWLKADSYTDKDGQPRNRVVLAASSFSILEKDTEDSGD